MRKKIATGPFSIRVDSRHYNRDNSAALCQGPSGVERAESATVEARSTYDGFPAFAVAGADNRIFASEDSRAARFLRIGCCIRVQWTTHRERVRGQAFSIAPPDVAETGNSLRKK